MAQVALRLGRLFGQDMSFVGLAAQHLAAGGNLKALRRTAPRFHFWHCVLQLYLVLLYSTLLRVFFIVVGIVILFEDFDFLNLFVVALGAPVRGVAPRNGLLRRRQNHDEVAPLE